VAFGHFLASLGAAELHALGAMKNTNPYGLPPILRGILVASLTISGSAAAFGARFLLNWLMALAPEHAALIDTAGQFVAASISVFVFFIPMAQLYGVGKSA
jgi:hypothetical protein